MLLALRLWIGICLATAHFVAAIKDAIVEIYPEIYVIQNDVSGVYEFDYFSILTKEFPYSCVFIDDRKLNVHKIIDEGHTQLSNDILWSSDVKEVYLRTYKFPLLRSGKHIMRLSLSETCDADGNATPIAQMLIDLHCKPIAIPLLGDRQRETVVCSFDPNSSRLIRRPKWLLN